MSAISKWVDDNFKKDPPFSFLYNDVLSKKFINSWVFTEESAILDNSGIKKIFSYKDPETKLKIICEVILYEDYSAVEWTLYFKNENKKNTPILENISAIDMEFPSTGEYNIHRISGSGSNIADYTPIVTPLSKGMNLAASCQGGRSSSGGHSPSQLGGSVPFFNLEKVCEDRGMIMGIGWTGQWKANFEHNTEETLRVQAGMEFTYLKLYPGEQIRTPKILILFWEGPDIQTGNNMLRRFIVNHKIPRINGKTVEIGIGATNWFQTSYAPTPPNPLRTGYDGSNDINEENQIELAHKCKELGIEYYWLDAGWHEGGFPLGNGTWVLKKDGFPNGWENLVNTLKELKLKFILWFEPERACPGSQLWQEHPEWLLRFPKRVREKFSFELNNRTFGYLYRNFGILNLGNIEARKWLIEHISKMVTDIGIDMFRHDINVDLLPFWKNADSKYRQGITEIKHIEGLYAFYDELLERHPNLIIDCVSAGNRRIDLETISRSIRMWTSDYAGEPIGIQSLTYGLNLFIPGHVGGIDPSIPFNKYVFRSNLSGGAVFTWDIVDKNFPEGLARKLIDEIKIYRPLFYGDFWPLTPHSLSSRVWMAWQFDRPDMGKGIVFAFRRPNAGKKIKLMLRGIDQDKQYEIHFVDKGIRKRIKGKELLEKGLTIEEDKAPESSLVAYEIMK